MWQGGGEEGERERETHSLTHRVKDWDLAMCVAGRRGGGREGARDTLTHSQGQGLGPSDVCGREEGRRERGNERHTHSLTHSSPYIESTTVLSDIVFVGFSYSIQCSIRCMLHHI